MKVLLHFEDWQGVETRIGVNITSPEPIIKREKDFWEWWDGTSYFKGERVLKEPQKIFVS